MDLNFCRLSLGKKLSCPLSSMIYRRKKKKKNTHSICAVSPFNITNQDSCPLDKTKSPIKLEIYPKKRKKGKEKHQQSYTTPSMRVEDFKNKRKNKNISKNMLMMIIPCFMCSFSLHTFLDELLQSLLVGLLLTFLLHSSLCLYLLVQLQTQLQQSTSKAHQINVLCFFLIVDQHTCT